MSEPPATLRLLVIEDSLSLLRLYSHVLTRAGYTLTEATSGREAQQIIPTQKPDIVLLDRVLPDIDGNDLCHWIKDTPGLSQTYVIMLSAFKTTEADRISGLEAGADDYIVKPVGERELLARIEVAARLKAAQSALEASEAKYRTLAENSPDLIMRLNKEGFPIYVNPRVHEMFGLRAEDVIGKSAYDLGIPDAVADQWFSTCQEVVSQQSARRFDFALPTPYMIKYMDARLVPEFDTTGEVSSILAVLSDITERVHTEQLLARLAAAVQQATEAVVMTDPDGVLQFFNAAFKQLTGVTDAALGQPVQDLYGSDEGIWKHVRQLLTDHVPWRGVSSLERQDGVLCDVEGSIFPVTDRSGEVTSIVAILRDFTERRRSEREREVLLSVASALRRVNSREEILNIVLDETMSLLNVAGAAITTIDPVTGRTYVEGAVGDYADLSGTHMDEERNLTAEILTSGKPFLYNELNTPDSPNFSVFQVASRTFLGVPMILPQRSIGVVWIASEHAITNHAVRLLEAIADMAANTLHRVALFEELEQYAADLELRVSERTSELAEANQQLRELDRLKSKFVSNVSHELRTPISNLKLYMSLLQRGKPEKRAHYEAMLQTSTERLGQLVEDILNLSRLEIAYYQPRDLELTDLNAVINRIIGVYQPQAQSTGLEITFHPDPDLPLIYGDINQLSQLVTNLVGNSFRYTPQGKITVSTASLDGRKEVSMIVEDTGIGILPDDLPHVFERFYRGNHRQLAEIPGTGLGLAIVKEIVNIHQGDISIDSKVNEGTRVEVTLPVKQSGSTTPNQFT